MVAKVDDKEEEDVNIDADYVVDEKAQHRHPYRPRASPRPSSVFNMENLADPENTTLSHHINQAIKAHGVMKRDIDYVVKDGEVIIVDEFTGRLMFGRRYSEGLHQAIEAKEHVKVASESKTLATITFQNYFRLYDKLSGMTGTAMTEQEEFGTIYELDIVEIPTNKPLARIDHPDVVYKTEAGKFRAVVAADRGVPREGPARAGGHRVHREVASCSVRACSRSEGIKHNVLNAKNHEKEAEIVAQAGKFGAVTVATNMAGRGTDIMLGGNAEFLAKADLRKAGMSDELIAEATGYAETDNEEILNARKMFAEAGGQVQGRRSGRRRTRSAPWAACSSWAPSATSPAASTTSCAAAPAVRATPARPASTSPWRTTSCACSAPSACMGMMEKLGVDEDTPIDAQDALQRH